MKVLIYLLVFLTTLQINSTDSGCKLFRKSQSTKIDSSKIATGELTQNHKNQKRVQVGYSKYNEVGNFVEIIAFEMKVFF